MASLATQQLTFADAEFVGIPLMTETSSGTVPAASDLQRWTDRHGLSGEVPLLGDPGWGVFETYVGLNENSFAVLIDANMRIVIKHTTYESPITDEEIAALLP